MKKAVLADRLFLSVDKDLKAKVEEETTHVVPSPEPGGKPLVIRSMARINATTVSIPIGRVDLIPYGYEIVEKRTLAPVEFPKFKGTLRPSQQEIYDSVDDNCIINAKVSFGKTYTALAVAGKLGQKTLVVVHTLALLDQWVRECEKVYGFKPDIIARGQKGLSTPIVVGCTRSLYNCVDDIRKEFGTVITDECHHISAPSMSKIVDKCRARYKIGLSGTITRKDGKHVVFKDYLGTTVYQPPKENSLTPEVHLINSDFKFPDTGQPWAKKVNKLLYDPEYIEFMAFLAQTYAAKGHSVLVVADRTEFLQQAAALCGESALCVTGSTTDRENELEKILRREKKILFGTQSIFSEGVSVNSLSCLILGTPINNEPLLEQLIGRIIRIHDETKPNPIVVDAQIGGRTAKRQALARRGFYIKEGYKIYTF